MAQKVFLLSPGGSLETVVEGVGAAVQSSFAVALTVDFTANLNTSGGSARAIQKAEVQQIIRTLEEFILRDSGQDWG